MSQVTIVRPDNLVYVDGLAAAVDCSSLSPDIHAIQWNDGTKWGDIEFVHVVGQREKPPNIQITDFSAYEFLRQAWRQKKDVH
jgi:hypothetical protein